MTVLMKTASWFTKLPEDHIRIGISRGIPRRQPAGYRVFKALAPGAWFNSVSPIEYDELYKGEVLGKLNPQQTFDKLREMAHPFVPVLLCFEAPNRGQWCHRAMVSAWFEKRLGIQVPEFGFEEPIPDHHPLMPPELRR